MLNDDLLVHVEEVFQKANLPATNTAEHWQALGLHGYDQTTATVVHQLLKGCMMIHWNRA